MISKYGIYGVPGNHERFSRAGTGGFPRKGRHPVPPGRGRADRRRPDPGRPEGRPVEGPEVRRRAAVGGSPRPAGHPARPPADGIRRGPRRRSRHPALRPHPPRPALPGESHHPPPIRPELGPSRERRGPPVRHQRRPGLGASRPDRRRLGDPRHPHRAPRRPG